MKVPAAIVSIVLSAMLLLQSWTLAELVNLKVAVARLGERVTTLQNQRYTYNHP